MVPGARIGQFTISKLYHPSQIIRKEITLKHPSSYFFKLMRNEIKQTLANAVAITRVKQGE